MTSEIGQLQIGTQHSPYIIAEMSGNHNGSLDSALEIVNMVADSGAHAIKLQTYKPNTMTLDLVEGEFYIRDAHSPWNGKSLYKLYEEAQTPWGWHKPIFEHARKLGLLAFSSPFDLTAVDFLETLDVPAYKIASAELLDLNLIRRVAQTKKPVILSTGMANIAEIHEAVETARSYGCPQVILLKCTATYPASPGESNLRAIPLLRDIFDLEVGLSDHTLGIGVAVAAVAVGATVIEKHVTLSRSNGGVDSTFSLEPDELKLLVSQSKNAHAAMGTATVGPSFSELESLKFRRSLYVVENINLGEPFTEKNIRAIRPGYGLPPKNLEVILGMKAKKNIKRGTPLSWSLIN